MPISTRISVTSAALLFSGGLLLLFVPDVALAWLVPDLPASAEWLGQLIGAGWLAVAVLDWLGRGSILGGIYGRPIVVTNGTLYFITAMVLISHATDHNGAVALWLPALPALLIAVLYAWLLIRGPIDGDPRQVHG